MLPDWQVLEFEEKAFWATAKSRLEIVPAPDNKKLWQLSVLSSVVNNSEQITVTFDPDSGRVYTRDRLSQGKEQRLKSYQYHDDVILRERRIPGSEPGVTARKWPVTSREKVTFPPSAADYVVTSPYLLLLLAQQLQSQDKDKSLTVLVHTDWNFYRVHLTHGNGVPLKVNYTVDGRDVVSAERVVVVLSSEAAPYRTAATAIQQGLDASAEVETVVVRTKRRTDYEEKLRRKTRTSGCAVGTVFGDMMEGLDSVDLPPTPVRTSDLYALAHRINTTPSLYLEAGAIHGTVLCQGARPLVYMEDVGRHNAVDKIAGWMVLEGTVPGDKILYTTGRLTSEMVIKTALMGIPALASRSGFTAWGVEIARRVGLTLIGRMRGRRFVCLAGEERLIRDADPASVPEEARRSARKASDDAA